MPIDVTFEVRGLAATLLIEGAVRVRKQILAIYRKAHKQALREWMTGASKATGVPGMPGRFTEAYGRTVRPRGEAYRKRVAKFYGRYLPFASPTPNGTKKRPDGAPSGHLRDNIKREGTGYRVSARNVPDAVASRLTLPAARILNLHPRYRGEFLALDRNATDRGWIERRVHELASAEVRALDDRLRRRRRKVAV